MKRFDLLKTVQLVILIVLTIVALVTILQDPVLYGQIAQDSHVRTLCVILWLVLAVSFAFLLYDFNAYTGLKRENMELDNAIYSDALTGIANRYSVDAYIGRFLNRPLPKDMGCVTIDLTNLSEINERHGHSAGDTAIQDFSAALQSAVSGVCFIGRNGGNKFVAIFQECSEKRLSAFLERLDEAMNDYNTKRPEHRILYVTGTAFDEGDEVHTLTELIALSDRRAWEKIKT